MTDHIHYYEPTQSHTPGIILSCGIHGDETAPITALQWLQSDLDKGVISPTYRVMLIYGNPEAIRLNRRFVTTNLNRLFGLEAKPDCAEAQRASQLEQACAEFGHRCGRVLLHLDLHSTIKPSLHPRFVLQPVSNGPSQENWTDLFQALGVSAWVKQTERSPTFSQFSRDHLQCDSFTLECGNLGSGHQFDADARQMYSVLRDLMQSPRVEKGPNTRLSSRTVATTASAQMTKKDIVHYRVLHNISRSSDDFRFLIDEYEPNFSLHEAGTAIYSDQHFTYHSETRVATLFLNASIALGQRAGLLLSPC